MMVERTGMNCREIIIEVEYIVELSKEIFDIPTHQVRVDDPVKMHGSVS